MTRQSKQTLSLIAALADNGVIGRNGDLPWHLPADLKHFKRLTWGHTLILGRKTHESIGRTLSGKTLPGRRSIVLSRRPPDALPGVEVAPDLDRALEMAGEGEVFVIGGAEVYRQALPRADRLYLTRVHAVIEGDTRFPDFEPGEWRVVEAEAHPADEQHACPFTFQRLERSP